MNNAVKAYRRRVRRCLHCSPCQKRRLMAMLDQMLQPILEESPKPDLNQLIQGLGMPEEITEELRKELPAGAEKRWRYISRGVLAALLTAVFLLLIYEAAFKPIEITVVEGTAEIIDIYEVSED